MLIARLIADTGDAQTADLQTRLSALTIALGQAGMAIAEATMLDHCGDVLELELPDGDPAALRRAIDTHFAPTAAMVLDRVPQVPHLLVSDMDSTMIGQECIDELADYAGLKDRIAAITERAMRGEIDFRAALAERVALLEGLDEAAIAACLADRIVPTPGARTLLATLKARGCRAVLVTGGFHHFADNVGDLLGFDAVVGNRLAVAGGKLTGALAGPIRDAATKQAVLMQEAERLGKGAFTLALGDGANDIPMLQAASCGIAWRAKPKARAAADGWVDDGALTAVLKLLGIPTREWVEG